jgi:alcohol dehydrogenase class IV
MVNKFSLIRTPRILFGNGQAEALPGLLKGRGINVLIVTGAKSHRQNTGIAKVLLSLEKEGYRLNFDKVEKEPSPGDIDRIVGRYRQIELDSVVAIGGGSVVDAGKAVSAMLPLEGSVRDYLEDVGTKVHPGIKKFFIAIPTTSGTGSEATSNTVLSETGVNGFKRSMRHENLVPDIAIVDPVLTLGCPAEITAASGMDAFTQLAESYLSVKSGSLTDALALEGIRNIHTCLFKAVTHGDDLEARSGMAYAALLSGITLANAGLGLIHGFASSIGGLYRVPHGVICGTMMGSVNRYNIEALLQQNDITLAHQKYGVLGMLFSGRNDKDLQWYMKYVADYIEVATEKLQIRRLGAFGISEADLERIADVTDHKSNPVKFDRKQLVGMLKARL